jgi:hypothetical protein
MARAVKSKGEISADLTVEQPENKEAWTLNDEGVVALRGVTVLGNELPGGLLQL